ncbi:MAG: class I SAM-dependent methyltransferase [Candidatus Pacearchaeota archaeon]|jgi:ubiquinone/menaquinone biosynthesis C-methylase UbiE
MTIPLKIIKKDTYDKEFGKPKQENIWDSISNLWEEYRVGKIPIVVEFLKDKKGKVIDLGCGSGRNMISNKDIEYYGVDFSSNQLACAISYSKESNIHAKFFKMSADKLSKKDFLENMFDYGLFIATLHCLETKTMRLNSLKEFYRVLKNGSVGLITVWNSSDERFNHVGNSGDIYMSWKKDDKLYMRYYYLYKKEEFIKLVESVGFKIEEFYEPRDKDRFSKKNWIIRVRK